MSTWSKPLLIYDGECNFCGRWIARWREATGDRVDYAPFQEMAHQFPQIPREAFEQAVQLIEPDGRISSAAEAVFRTLAYAPRKRWMLWLYEKIPGFRGVSDACYRLVADHRVFFSFLTRIFWGKDLLPSTFTFSSWLFFRAMGMIYLIAFISLWTQIEGLVGSNGILPVKEYLELAHEKLGSQAYFLLPTLSWLNASDAHLHLLCGGGALLALLLIFGVAQVPVLILLWTFYLSLTTISQDFLSFQWDILLLEAGFLAIFLAPLSLLRGGRGKVTVLPAGRQNRHLPSPSKAVLFLLRWLLFRLMFFSGVVKLASGDPTWRNLTALTYHYETQCLPPWTAWYVHQLPEWFQKGSTFMMFGIELALPFLIFGPRRLKFLACAGITGLQFLIMATGNYCFFNLLTLALCLLLLDDSFWRRLLDLARPRSQAVSPSPSMGEGKGGGETPPPPHPPLTPPIKGGGARIRNSPPWITIPVAAAILLISATHFTRLFRWPVDWPTPVLLLRKTLAPFHIVNSYGLFAVMTTERPEIILEGSNDAENWLPYEFKYKPGDLKRKPRFVWPHQPRLDWQMWFAALSDFRLNLWFLRFCERILEGSPEVLALVEKNPFPEKPPRYLRAVVYDYHFTTPAKRRATGAWWRRTPKGLYCPVLSLKDR